MEERAAFGKNRKLFVIIILCIIDVIAWDCIIDVIRWQNRTTMTELLVPGFKVYDLVLVG